MTKSCFPPLTLTEIYKRYQLSLISPLFSFWHKNTSPWLLFAASLTPLTLAAEPLNQPILIEEITVTGGVDSIQTLPGSATWIDTEELEQYEHTDIHQVLREATGVYVRDEDGYGLRPNIGMRGAPAERSQKITLMEDGILIGPAPYSAPAAYYFPNISRMHAVEIFKGPSAIAYGPHTVGGALNLITTPIPEYFSGEINTGFGSDGFYRLHSHIGTTSSTPIQEGQWGFLIEGLTFGSDGFKTLDNGGDTGFERHDVDTKVSFQKMSNAGHQHQFLLKIGAGNEHSDETYLGLTDADFALNPYQRYAGSQLDQMDWDHTKLHFDHQLIFSDSLKMTTRLYRNDFTRAWQRFDGFRSNTQDNDPLLNAPRTIEDILTNPTGLIEARYLDILSGAVDSSGTEIQKLDIVTNDREYRSQGIEWLLKPSFQYLEQQHDLTLGLRYHEDDVDRFHSVRAYNMINGILVYDGIERDPRLSNIGETSAYALFVRDNIQYRQWQTTLGLRAEHIQSKLTDRLNPAFSNEQNQSVLIPGVGIFYQYSDQLGFLAGVNRGFSPSAPGPVDPTSTTTPEPEISVNWETGLRYQQTTQHSSARVESIVFFSDYSNLLGRCRTSDAAAGNCNDGEEINGGAVEIAGLELSSGYQWHLQQATIPLELTYTYTQSAFQSSFNSNFSQWGTVLAGDELPYLPEHVLALEIGYQVPNWSVELTAQYTSEMREQAGTGEIPDTLQIDERITIDGVGQYFYNDALKFQFKIANLTDEIDIVSRRPFGARPNRPRSVEFGVQYLFE